MQSTSPWPSIVRVPPDFGVRPGFRPCWPKFGEPGDELPDDVVPLLPPHAAATSARTARPAAAAKDCVRLRIDIPLLISAAKFVPRSTGALGPIPHGMAARQTAPDRSC